MKNGFIKVSAATPKLKVAAIEFNTKCIIENIIEAEKKCAKIIVFPELSITSYTCGDLFLQDSIINRAKCGLENIVKATKNMEIIAVVGLPVSLNGKLYNSAAFVQNGEILGIVTKSNLPNYGGLCEVRYFSTLSENTTVKIGNKDIPFGNKLVFCCKQLENFKIACEICEDLWVPTSPAISHTMNGATVIVNPSASYEISGKSKLRHTLISSQSARTNCAYIYANAGLGESTTDFVFAGNNMIYEDGNLLVEAELFEEGIIYTDIDVDRLVFERRKANTSVQVNDKSYENIYFNMEIKETVLDRKISRLPFIPSDESERAERCETIISLQYHGLKKRLEHIGCTSAIVGVSGGLDSTLALLITVKAFESLNIPVSGITAVTMPCFGTSDRTYENAKTLMENLGVTIMEVNIKSAVTSHLSDIGSDISHHDVTYENAQARERTQVLMDLANLKGGIVIGTGDLSELALGFATYNGDHMSMYGVNASVPKTLMRYLVTHIANKSEEVLKKTLLDIVATPVSPELLPPESGVITQHTEDIVGPYELHDFFLYYQIRFGCDAEKIKRMCCIAFEGVYKCEEVEKWLNMFTKRFYQNQFKRSCLPDGVKVGSVSLSPRGDFCIPSDVQI